MNDNPQIKLAISMCTNRTVHPRAEMGLAMMIHTLTAYGVPFGIISRMQASLLPQARQECLDEALADECTHQLWLDDDIEPPADCVLRMLQSMRMRPEIDAIASNYVRKQDTLQYTAEDLDGKMMESHGKLGVQEAKRIGMGLVLFNLNRLRGIPAPHFEVRWVERYQKYMGEDRYFTEKLREKGIRIFVDHGISNWTQHWGEIGYSPRLWHPIRPNVVAPAAAVQTLQMSDQAFHRAQDGLGE